MLTAFGRAYGALPENIGDLSSDQDSFLDQSISGLAQDGKIISVRLALFAEMVKGKPWTPATLKEVGGTEGIGLTFLEETFSASTAPPEHRLHQKAAQAVLKALLPETGTDIKGQMRSRQELLEASGYANRPRDFDDLIHILDPELRLITPTDPEGSAERRDQARPTERAILPTHPRLPGSLPAGLADPQAEGNPARPGGTAAGGTLGLWNAKPENRHLPSLWEWLGIRTLTDRRRWTDPAAGHDATGQSVPSITIDDRGGARGTPHRRWACGPGIASTDTGASCSRRKPESRKQPASKGSSDAW